MSAQQTEICNPGVIQERHGCQEEASDTRTGRIFSQNCTALIWRNLLSARQLASRIHCKAAVPPARHDRILLPPSAGQQAQMGTQPFNCFALSNLSCQTRQASFGSQGVKATIGPVSSGTSKEVRVLPFFDAGTPQASPKNKDTLQASRALGRSQRWISFIHAQSTIQGKAFAP